METLLPQVAVTPETVAWAIEAWRGGPAGPQAGVGSSAHSRSEAKAVQPIQRSSSERERAVAPGRGVWLEVGFGGGEHLAWHAARNPDTLLVGAEPFVNGVAKLLSAVEEENLRNVRVRHGDARDLMAAMPDGSVTRAFVLHPDPWPKRKHWKRRIVSVPFLTEMHRLVAPGGELRVASDIADYVRWTLVMRDLAERKGARWEWTARRMDDWTERPDDWPQTRYEAKALREGRVPHYLRFEAV